MWAALGAAVVALFKALIPFLWDKSNEARSASDLPPLPAGLRQRWIERVRRATSSLRP